MIDSQKLNFKKLPKRMSKGEKHVAIILKYLGIHFYYSLIPVWLHGMHLDFYLPKYHIGIEYDGSQHLRPSTMAGYSLIEGLYRFHMSRKRDYKKTQLVLKHNICLLRLEDYDDSLCHNNLLNLIHIGINYLMSNKKNIICLPDVSDKIKYYEHIYYMVNYAKPLANNNLRDYMLNSKSYNRNVLLYDLLTESGFLHRTTKSILSFKYPNDIHKIPNIDSNELYKYLLWRKSSVLKSNWLFPNILNPKKNCFSSFNSYIKTISKKLKLNYINIFSLRKTGLYLFYKHELLLTNNRGKALKQIEYTNPKIDCKYLHINFRNQAQDELEYLSNLMHK